MHREILYAALDAHRRTWIAGLVPFPGRSEARERDTLERLEAFARSTPDCFERSHLAGHVTGSALVVSPALDRVLLTLHGKLGKWLQLGGHSDGDPDPARVALTEAREESGLEDLAFLAWEAALGAGLPGPVPFDLDIHPIPARGEVPEHLHYDVRYLVVAPEGSRPVRSHESRDLRWLTLAEARAATDEESMLRQFLKLEALRARLAGAGPTGSASPAPPGG